MSKGDTVSKVVVVVLISAGCAFGQDWPEWRGPNRDGKVSGFAAPQVWPEALTQKWKTTVGTGDATPALVSDRLYVHARQGSDEVILCLNAADGQELWRDQYAAPSVTGPASAHPGPRSSPTVAGGKVITLGVGGTLSCLDAATGTVVWRNNEYKNVPRFFAAMSPIVVDGACIAHLGGDDDGALVALDLATGETKWKWAGDAPAYASPVLMTVGGTKQVVVQTAKNLVGVAVADGALLWKVATPAQQRAQNAVTPIVVQQTVVYSGQGLGTKAVTIEKQGDGFTAKERWSNDEVGTTFNTPVLKDGLLFGMSARGNLFCLDAQTGKAAWTDSNRSDRFAAILDAGSVMLALPGTAELIAFKPSDKEYQEVARIKVAETATYAHPVVAGNRIFVRDKESVTLYAIQ